MVIYTALEVAADNIKKAQAHQAKTYNAKHARNDFEVDAKVWKKNPLWNTKQKSLKKGPMWRGTYEVEGKTSAGNYLLKDVKGKGKVRNTAIPPNQLKRYIARSQNIPAKCDDKYASESDGDDDQGPPIGTNSPVSSDADTILYADSEDDKGIPGHSSGVPIPGHTSSSDETIEVEGKTSAGNYLLKDVKGKGKVRNTAIPPNQLKRYIARSQNIPAKCDDKYASESDGDDDQGPPIGTNSPVSSDADTILYADSEDDKGIPGHSSGVPIPGHTSSSDETIEIELGQIPGHTSGGDTDDTIEIDIVREIPGHIAHGCTMEAAEILATLAAGGDPDWLPDLTVPEEPEESLVQVLVALAEEADGEIPDDTSADAEIPGRKSKKSPIIIVF